LRRFGLTSETFVAQLLDRLDGFFQGAGLYSSDAASSITLTKQDEFFIAFVFPQSTVGSRPDGAIHDAMRGHVMLN
jgi:hypothetical protein